MESQGRKIHGLAAKAREDGNHLDALKLYDEAILAYQEGGDILGLSEVFADRAIIYRHLFDATSDKNFLIIAKHEMLASVEMAEETNEKQTLAIPYFQLANVQRDLGELGEAIVSYKKAIDNQTNNPAPQHDRPTVLIDMKCHLATCEYRMGDKSALQKALQALSDLENSDEVKYNEQGSYTRESSYNKAVWVSGAHMRIAEMLREDDPQKAKEHLQKAKEIIDANPDLKIRKQQWEKLAETFES